MRHTSSLSFSPTRFCEVDSLSARTFNNLLHEMPADARIVKNGMRWMTLVRFLQHVELHRKLLPRIYASHPECKDDKGELAKVAAAAGGLPALFRGAKKESGNRSSPGDAADAALSSFTLTNEQERFLGSRVGAVVVQVANALHTTESAKASFKDIEHFFHSAANTAMTAAV